MRNPIVATAIFIALIVGCIAAKPAAVDAQGKRCTLTIKNGSARDFNRLHISWSRAKDWGPNLLENPLRRGMEISRTDIVPAAYDMLVVDSYGNHCTLNVPVHNDTTLTITEELLSNSCSRG